ncbi:MAG: hypothetical protein LBF78_08745, partial [Treponema sp.]|nr:hypothetical protein [Treponema sp.]
MKKISIGLLVVAAVLLLLSASVWEGSAAVAAPGALPESGYYAATNSFPGNTVVDITNLANGRTIRVIVAGTLETPGLLVMLSRDAADAIELQSRSIGRVKMSQPADPVAFARFTEGKISSGDPDFDPAAVPGVASAASAAPLAIAPQAAAEAAPGTAGVETAEAASDAAGVETPAAAPSAAGVEVAEAAPGTAGVETAEAAPSATSGVEAAEAAPGAASAGSAMPLAIAPQAAAEAAPGTAGVEAAETAPDVAGVEAAPGATSAGSAAPLAIAPQAAAEAAPGTAGVETAEAVPGVAAEAAPGAAGVETAEAEAAISASGAVEESGSREMPVIGDSMTAVPVSDTSPGTALPDFMRSPQKYEYALEEAGSKVPEAPGLLIDEKDVIAPAPVPDRYEREYFISEAELIPPVGESPSPAKDLPVYNAAPYETIPGETSPGYPQTNNFSVPVISDLEKGKYYIQLAALSKVESVENEIKKIDSSLPRAV